MIDVTDQVQAQEEVRRQAEQLRRTVEGAVLAMSQVVETRDPYTAGHERRVAELATAIGRELGLGDAELDGLRLGSLIHDIGKIAVPAEILAKPGRLSTVEFNLIKQHAQSGYEILSVIDFGRPVAEMVLQHHERLDGSGYPQRPDRRAVADRDADPRRWPTSSRRCPRTVRTARRSARTPRWRRSATGPARATTPRSWRPASA